ncbi:MAG: agmatinase family protein [Gammaproteobacteria bacterium]
MFSSKNLLVIAWALIPIWIVVGQDFTPSLFDRDDGQIPLNTSDPSFDPWSQLRDSENDPTREPGPFYPGRLNNMGVVTFFNLPVAVTEADLVAGEVDVAIMGAEIDMGVGMRGAKYGPGSLRESLGVLGVGQLPHMHTGVAWQRELRAVDYGNAPIDRLSVERSMTPVREMVRQIASTGAIPIVIGGDHSLEYADVAGVADVYGKENVGVIHFDAHYDAAGDSQGGHLISHSQPIYQLIEEGHVLGENYIQVGLRGFWPGEEGFEWMRENNFRYHTMVEIERDGWDAVMERILAEANDGPEYLYVSFDIDVLDPAFASGTGTPEPGGLMPREVFPLIRALCTENNLVGFELVELNPLVDPGYTTVMNANRVVQECLTGIAMRRIGITDGAYLNPLTVEDGQPDNL